MLAAQTGPCSGVGNGLGFGAMKSMTGYGREEVRQGSLQFEAAVKVVNGRFFEVKFSLPREWQFLESELRQKVKEKIHRGHVDVLLFRKSSELVQAGVKSQWPNSEAVRAFSKNLASLEKGLKRKVVVNLSDLLGLQGVTGDGAESDEAVKSEVLRLFDRALAKLELEREREGKALKTQILMSVGTLKKICSHLEQRRKLVEVELHRKLQEKVNKRLEELKLSSQQVDHSRIHLEIALWIEKSDVSEEFVRIQEHLRAFEDVAGSKSRDLGKKLDFYTQELLREFNTLGSKSPFVEFSQGVVEAKLEIEKLKEQIQNIE